MSPTTVMKVLKESDDYQPNDDGTINVTKRKGLDGKMRPSRRFNTTRRDNQIIALREAGLRITSIAEHVGRSVGTVHRVLNR